MRNALAVAILLQTTRLPHCMHCHRTLEWDDVLEKWVHCDNGFIVCWEGMAS